MRDAGTAIVDLARASWRKSTYSGDTGGQCVEVAAPGGGERVTVRDSKQPAGPVLAFGRAQWMAFVHDVKDGVCGGA